MYSIKEFANKVGVSVYTLRNWEKNKKLIPAYRTKGNQRRYSDEQYYEVLQKNGKPINKVSIAYCRVSSNHQKDDLERQIKLVESFIASKGERYEIITDIGSGINYKKNGLKRILELVSQNRVSKIYILHKDRLVRFGYELIEYMCSLHNVEIVQITKTESKSDEQEMIEDIMNIIHVFSCRMNGKRSKINNEIKKRLDKSL